MRFLVVAPDMTWIILGSSDPESARVEAATYLHFEVGQLEATALSPNGVILGWGKAVEIED